MVSGAMVSRAMTVSSTMMSGAMVSRGSNGRDSDKRTRQGDDSEHGEQRNGEGEQRWGMGRQNFLFWKKFPF